MQEHRRTRTECVLLGAAPNAAGAFREKQNRWFTAHDRTAISNYFDAEQPIATVAHGEAMLPQVRNRWMVGARLPAYALTNPLPLKLEERLTALEPGYQRLIVGFEILCIEIESSRIVDVMRNSAQIDTAETAHLLLEGGPTPAVAC